MGCRLTLYWDICFLWRLCGGWSWNVVESAVCTYMHPKAKHSSPQPKWPRAGEAEKVCKTFTLTSNSLRLVQIQLDTTQTKHNSNKYQIHESGSAKIQAENIIQPVRRWALRHHSSQMDVHIIAPSFWDQLERLAELQRIFAIVYLWTKN